MSTEDSLGQVLPIYFVADESGSMHSYIGELNDGLNTLLDELSKETMAASKVRFSILGFSDNVLCHLDLADLRDVETMPALAARGSTSYAAAFNDLHQRIPADVARLKSEGYKVNRPAVFFLTDGMPNAGDGWEAAHTALVDSSFREHPNVLSFGVGAANAENTVSAKNIVAVATKEHFAFVAASGTDTGTALAEFSKSLTQSVVSSGQALADGGGELPFEPPENFVMAVDIL